MKYVKFEFQKLFGIRYVWIFLIIMLGLNAILCAYSASSYKNNSLPIDSVIDFFNLYTEDSDQINSDYIEYKGLLELQDQLIYDAYRRGDYEYEPEKIQNKYSDKCSDGLLYDTLYGHIKKMNSYPESVLTVIDRAKENLKEFDYMGISPDAYNYKYQLKVISLYERAQTRVRIGFEYPHGWDAYFENSSVNIFIAASLLIIGSVIFTFERNTGILPVIRITRKGKLTTACSKIVIAFISTIAVVLLFTLTTWLIYGIYLGYGSPYNAIQAYNAYSLCPYIITIGQYFAVTVIIKIAVFFAFTLSILAASAFLQDYMLSYVFGALIFGINYIFNVITYKNTDNILKYINLFSVSKVSPLFYRYRAFNFFGSVFDLIPFSLTITGAVIIIASAAFIWKYSSGTDGIRTLDFSYINKNVKKLFTGISRKKEAEHHTIMRPRHMNLFGYELYKTLFVSHGILIIIIILAVKCIISYNEIIPTQSFNEAVYQEYMTTFKGELDDDKRSEIFKIRANFNSTLEKYDFMQNSYAAGNLSYDEYHEYLIDYYYANSRNELFLNIENHVNYIDNTQEEKEIKAQFVYDTGWKKLIFSGTDYTLYAAIIIITSGIFTIEFKNKSSSGAFAYILRSTKAGRRRTFISKYCIAIIIGASLMLIWSAVDLTFIINYYELPLMSAPAVSIESLCNIGSDITILQYLLIMYMLRFVGAIMLAVITCSFSEILKKSIPILSTVVIITLLPDLLYGIGVSFFSNINFMKLFQGTDLLISASGWINTVVFICVLCIISVGVYMVSRRKWCK